MPFFLRTLLRNAVFSVESSKFPESSVRFTSQKRFQPIKLRLTCRAMHPWMQTLKLPPSTNAKSEIPCRNSKFFKSVSVSKLCANLRKFWVKSGRGGIIFYFCYRHYHENSYKRQSTFLFRVSFSFVAKNFKLYEADMDFKWSKFSSVKKNCWIGKEK